MIERILGALRVSRPIEVVAGLFAALIPIVLLVAVLGALAFSAAEAIFWATLAYLVVAMGASLLAFRSRLIRVRALSARAPLRSAAVPISASTELRAANLPTDAQRVLAHAAGLPHPTLRLFGVRTGSVWARDALTSSLTGGRLRFDDLAAVLGSPSALPFISGLSVDGLLDLGRMFRRWPRDDADRATLSSLLGYVAERWPALDRGRQEYVAEWLISEGRTAEALPIVLAMKSDSVRARALMADVLNPHAGGSASEGAWIAALNSMLQPFGLERLDLLADGTTPFDRVAAPGGTPADGPLISVIVTTFRPDHGLETAVRSIIEQTWTNWELLVMDDASPAEFGPILDAAEALDPRVRVVRASHNQGTYVRRNDGMRLAVGELLTIQDADDWSHPRRLEIQAAHLLGSPELPANVSLTLRSGEDLRFSAPGRIYFRPAESTILFRLPAVLERLGAYDAVRKAGDREFRLRMEAAFDAEIPVVDSGGPLSLIRHSTTSLSGSDFGDGWVRPERLSYRDSMAGWHARIRAGEARPILEHPLVDRRIAAPSFLLDRTGARRYVDLVVIADLRPGARSSTSDALLASELAIAGRYLSVAVVHSYALSEDASIASTEQPLQQLVDDGVITRVEVTDAIDAGTVVVRNATALQGHPAVRVTMTAERVIVGIESAVDIPGSTFARSDVEPVIEAMFGGPAEWRAFEGSVELAEWAAPARTP